MWQRFEAEREKQISIISNKFKSVGFLKIKKHGGYSAGQIGKQPLQYPWYFSKLNWCENKVCNLYLFFFAGIPVRPVRWLASPRVPPAQVEVYRDSDDNNRNNRIVQFVLMCMWYGGERVWKEARYIRRIVVTQAKALISACLCPIHACAKCMNKTIGNCHQKTHKLETTIKFREKETGKSVPTAGNSKFISRKVVESPLPWLRPL